MKLVKALWATTKIAADKVAVKAVAMDAAAAKAVLAFNKEFKKQQKKQLSK
jgi:hypothetical protein